MRLLYIFIFYTVGVIITLIIAHKAELKLARDFEKSYSRSSVLKNRFNLLGRIIIADLFYSNTIYLTFDKEKMKINYLNCDKKFKLFSL